MLLKLLPETSLSWRDGQFTSNIKSITVLKKSSPKSWNLSGGEGDGVEGRSVVTGRWKQTQNQSSTLRNTNITPYATGNAACKAHVGTKEKAPAYITHVACIRKADRFCQTNPLDQKWLETTASLPTQVFQTAGKGQTAFWAHWFLSFPNIQASIPSLCFLWKYIGQIHQTVSK